MKKVTMKFNHNGADTFEEFYKAKLDSFAEDEFRTLFTEIKGMVDGGDIWFRHFENVGDVNNITYIVDSDAAMENFKSARDILEAQPEFIETVVEDITFEEFAAYATEHDETFIQHDRKDALLS